MLKIITTFYLFIFSFKVAYLKPGPKINKRIEQGEKKTKQNNNNNKKTDNRESRKQNKNFKKYHLFQGEYNVSMK